MRLIQSAVSSVVAFIFLVACSLTAAADWTLVRDRSEVTYLSSKMTGGFATVFENNRFRSFSSVISDGGKVMLDIDLDSVDTGVVIRDERVREHVFNTAEYPRASVRLSVGDAAVKRHPPGHTQAVEAALTMRGVTRQVKGEVSVTQGDDVLLVQTTAPILVNAADYGMLDGFETLKELVKLFNIPTTIPVSFKLVFVRK